MIDKLGTKWIEIDLDALKHNLRAIQKRVAPAGVIAVIKADAYGHGAVEVAQAAEKCGIRIFAVSCLEEAIELRRAFFNREILVFGSLPESQVCDIVNYGLTPSLCTLEFARALSIYAAKRKKTVKVHVCVDTGMGRVGPYYTEAVAFIRKVAVLKNLKLEGLYSHFSTSDDDASFAQLQKGRFDSLLAGLKKCGIRFPLVHLANSGGVLNVPGSRYHAVRTGLIMYGIYPSPRRKDYPELKNVFSLKTRVAYVRHVPQGFSVGYGRKYVTAHATDIITLPVGYADGFPRKFTNKGQVLINGRRLPVVGSVCMDMIMVDAGKNSRIKIGEVAVLVGRQGKEAITVYDMARDLETIPYEVICVLGKRLTRVYIKDRRVVEVKRMIPEF
ncbi:MAG: alanine racemase [Fibrobacterota bacterium]